MSLSKVVDNEEMMGFVFKNTSTSTVNLIRRMCHNIETYALKVTELNKTEIDTPIIEQRISLIPVVSSMAENAPEDLVFTGFGNNEEDNIKEFQAKHLVASDGRTGYFSDDEILIMTLFRGKSIEVSAVLEKGSGYNHSKWCPVAPCTYRFLTNKSSEPEENSDGSTNYDKIINDEKNFKIDKNGFKEIEVIMHACGQLPPREIWLRNMDLILSHIDRIRGNIENDNEAGVRYFREKEHEINIIWKIQIMDCDDGIADVISEEIGNNSDCKYSSYRQEHPLESMKNIIIGIKNTVEPKTILLKSIEVVRNRIIKIKDEILSIIG